FHARFCLRTPEPPSKVGRRVTAHRVDSLRGDVDISRRAGTTQSDANGTQRRDGIFTPDRRFRGFRQAMKICPLNTRLSGDGVSREAAGETAGKRQKRPPVRRHTGGRFLWRAGRGGQIYDAGAMTMAAARSSSV